MSDPQQQAQGQSDSANPFDQQRQQKDQNYARTIFIAVMGWVSISVEVIFRRKFGERYFNAASFALSFIAFAVSLAVVDFWAQVRGESPLNDSIGFAVSPERVEALRQGGTAPFIVDHIAAAGGVYISLIPPLYVLFFLLGTAHLAHTWWRNWKGERWHSYSFGISWLDIFIGERIGPLVIDDWILYRFVEPALVLMLAASASLNSLPRVLSGWLWLAGLTLLIKNNLLYRQMRNRVLDLIDAQIEADYIADALEGREQQATAGFVLVRPPAGLVRPAPARPEGAQALASAPPLDFSDVLADTLGQRPPTTGEQTAPPLQLDRDGTAPAQATGERTPPFDSAVPAQAPSAGTALPWPSIRLLGGAGVVAVLFLVLIVAPVLRGARQPQASSSPGAAQATPEGQSAEALPTQIPTRIPTAQPEPFQPITLPGAQPPVPAVPTLAPPVFPTSPPTAAGEPPPPGDPGGDLAPTGQRYRVLPTEDGFISVRASARADSTKVAERHPGELVTCERVETGQQVLGTDQWLYCPAEGGYILSVLVKAQ